MSKNQGDVSHIDEGEMSEQLVLTDAEIIDAWKMFPNWGHEQHILMFGRELLKKASEK
jgi:hypothetical protein